MNRFWALTIAANTALFAGMIEAQPAVGCMALAFAVLVWLLGP